MTLRYRWLASRQRGLAVGALLLAALVAGMTGCGRKGAPVAPERRLPAPPSSLTASVDGASIVLRWVNPVARRDGSRLRDLATLGLHRREEADGVEPGPALVSRGRVVGFEQVASIRLDAPGPAEVQGQSVTWTDTRDLGLGRRYTYVVTAMDATGRSSPPSTPVVVRLVAAPEAPRGLVATAGDGRVSLHWQAPGRFIDGSPVADPLRYLVLRGPEGEEALAPITPAPVEGTEFLDTGVQNERVYRYAVRAVRVGPGSTAAGAAGAVVAVTPVDTTPPAPPRGLVAVPAGSTVRLAWSQSPDADVALHAVYRAVGAGDFLRIATTPAAVTFYVDTDVRPGQSYRYEVTALDGARRPNESARSNTAIATAE